ncbi:hypothetical protein FVEG_03652 [Fusarium verticillioides 7600]|uniref:F-box domain-containing protein n=1 Tax=Gibberella moniliformis (strain M3125 / FGSC 7600) TaxID=334819 RepID=W7M239_GIBM7|nr:hypothetical protein FVEG_03652 [Fusarium verticillioides 7600]EWG41564.1 hypothetical protein FVEG_03652 [Fusarium verticillioides 7600]
MARTRLQKSTADYFSKLAPEILRSIFAYFCPHCCNEYQCPFGAPPDSNRAEHNTALYNLCLVSRYFRLSAQEILHHSFDPYYATWDPPNPWERRLEPFLLTMASRPDLARSVKTLFLKSRLLESLDFDKSRNAFDTCTRVFGSSSQELYRRSRKTRLSAIRRAFFRGTRSYTYMRPQEFIPIVGDQLLSILVAILPNLSHISIEEDRRWEFDVSPATLDNLGVRSIPLKTLETEHALPNLLARAPGLETLVTAASSEFPNMPCLRNLHIRSKDAVLAPAIEHLLSECTGTLSTFSYNSFDSDIVGVVNLLDKPRFHASLETLHLNMLKTDSKGDHKMPSLKQFNQLKRLFLHTYFLYGSRSPTCCRTECKVKSLFDILPSSIISLDLSERTPTPDGRIYDDLLILSKDAAFAFPQLKEIRSNADHVCDEYPQALFKSVGVDLIYQDLTTCCWIDTVVRIIGSGDCYHYDLGYGGGAMPLPSELSDDDL